MNELIHIRYNHLSPWEGLNPRQYFDPVKGQELQGSIREHGIQETLLVAAVEGKPGEYKVIAGERRWRETQALLQVFGDEGTERHGMLGGTGFRPLRKVTIKRQRLDGLAFALAPIGARGGR